jgi:hypothetical protein
MAIQTNYDFNGLTIPNAYVRIDRLWGSSREGWNSLVGVYMEVAAPAISAVGIEGEEGYVPAQPATMNKNLIKEFNHSTPYVAGERGYVSLYISLMADLGGVEV